MAILPVKGVVHKFQASDLVGGHPVLDFINTVTGRDKSPRDWLDGYPQLLEWARQAKLLAPDQLSTLEAKGAEDVEAARLALVDAKRLREALHLMFVGLAAGLEPTPVTLATVQDCWIRAAKSHTLTHRAGKIWPYPDLAISGLEIVADCIAYLSVELAQDFAPKRLRVCAGENCGWIFLDSSKAGRRRWCDMATCGNTAKYRRHARKARAIVDGGLSG